MKKTFLALVVIGIVAAAGMRPAFAQTDPAVVKVPFQFIAGDRLMPAGTYRIAPDAQDPTLLAISDVNGKGPGAFTSTVWTGSQSKGTKVQVQFKNVDGHYFLWQVAIPSAGDRAVPINKMGAERVLAHLNLMPAERADVAK